MSQITTIKSKFLRGVFEQNTYVLTNKNEAVIIDAGADLEDVKNAVAGKKVLAILITHLHFDHLWYIEDYVNEFGCDVFVQEGAEIKLTDPRLNASFIAENMTFNLSKKFIKYYAKKLTIGSFDFEVYFTPGHASDCVCILWEKNLFAGDTVFADGIGRTDLVDSNPFEMVNSLKTILSIDFDVAYAGHYKHASKKEIEENIKCYL